MERHVIIGLAFIMVGIIGFITGFTTKVDSNEEKELLAKKEKGFF